MNEVKKWIIVWLKNKPKLALLLLLLPLAGLYSSVVESYPSGIAYQNCSGCHNDGAYPGYEAFWSNVPSVIERNTAVTVTFSIDKASGDPAIKGGFSAQTNLGTFTANTGNRLETDTNITHSEPTSPESDGDVIWSFDFNSGSTSGTATLEGYGNPVNGNGASSGDGPAKQKTVTFDINNSPVLIAGVSSASFVENGSAIEVAPSLSLSDTENSADEIASGTVTITTNYSSDDGDRLNILSSICTNNDLSCSGSGTRTITISGGSESAAEFENVLEAITFSNTSDTPSTSTRAVQFSVNDQFSRTITSSRNVAVQVANDAPVITEGAGPSTHTISEDSNPTAFSLTLNATDPDSATLTWSISVAASNGTASTSGTGLSKAISYVPDTDYTGSDSFTVQVSDGTATDTIVVNVNIVAVTDPPVITEGDSALSKFVSEDSNLIFALNATDSDSDTLTWSISTAASHGTAYASGTGASKDISYTPNTNYYGSDSFTVQVSDGGATPDTIVVNVSVGAVNDAPVITEGNSALSQTISVNNTPTAFGLTLNATDLDSGTLTWSISVAASNGTASTSGTGLSKAISYVPATDYTGSDSFTVQVSDGYLTDTIVINLTINLNDAPVITEGAGPLTQTISVNNTPTAFSLTLNATDSDSGTLTWSISVAASNGTASVSGTGLSKAISYTPTTDYKGSDSFTVQVTDGNSTDTIVVNVTISAIEGIANLVINSTGYLTPYLVVPPTPTLIEASATSVSAAVLEKVDGKLAVVGIETSPATTPKTITVDSSSSYRPGHHDIVWTASNSSGDLATYTQSLKILPIVSFAPDQQVEEGSVVNVVAMLNGSAASYPVSINFTASGTADAIDHNAVEGSLVITAPNQMISFSFDVMADILVEGTETVIFTMTSAINAVIGRKTTHTVSIVEDNVMPVVNLQISQGGNKVSTAYVSNGAVTVNAIVTDANSAQTHSYDWSMTSNSLSPPTDTVSSSWIFTPVAGNYLIDLAATDSGSPALLNRVSQVINISGGAVPTLKDRLGNNLDSDGDAVLDIIEGYGDSDQDGIPDYLDAQSAGATDQHLIPNQTAALDNTSWFLVETEPGMKIVIGNTARASSNNGALVTDTNIASFGSNLGGVPLNASDSFEHVGGIYDFEVSGLIPGQSANIVFPLQSSIPVNASFRKFNPATGWSNFVVDTNNRLASAAGMLGTCPEPGSIQYVDGLVAFSNCLQLTIQDGGSNDADGVVNGVIKDPGSISITLQAPEVAKVQEGSGRIDFILLIGLFLLIGSRAWAFNRDISR